MALLARYKLDETTGTTASDSVGTVNGTISGGVTLDKDGIEGRSFAFDGVDGKIAFPTGNFEFERTDSFSISAWVKLEPGSNSTIFSKFSFDNAGITFSARSSDGFIRVVLVNNTGAAGNRIVVASNVVLDFTKWVHVVMTYDGSSTAAGVSLYADSVLQTNTVSSDTLASSILLPSETATLGIRGGTSQLPFDGVMDDVRIYDSELNAADVANLYNSYSLDNQNLIAHYLLDETAGLTSTDSAGTVDGTISGGVTLNQTGAAPNSGTSYLFDGVDGKIAFPTGNFEFERTDSFSISAWVSTSSATAQTIISKLNSGATSGYLLSVNASGTVGILIVGTTFGNRIDVNTSDTVISGNFNLITITYDGSSTAAGTKIYINGSLATNVTSSDTLTTTTITPAQPLEIGNRDANLNPLNGNIDDARVYNSELTAAEVANLYNSYSLIDPNNAISIEWVKQAVVGTPGSGNVSLGAAEAGFIAFQDDERVVNDAVLHYVIEDGINRERGVGLFTSSGSILARSNILAKLDAGVLTKNPTVGLDLSSSAIVFTAAIAQ